MIVTVNFYKIYIIILVRVSRILTRRTLKERQRTKYYIPKLTENWVFFLIVSNTDLIVSDHVNEAFFYNNNIKLFNIYI